MNIGQFLIVFYSCILPGAYIYSISRIYRSDNIRRSPDPGLMALMMAGWLIGLSSYQNRMSIGRGDRIDHHLSCHRLTRQVQTPA